MTEILVIPSEIDVSVEAVTADVQVTVEPLNVTVDVGGSPGPAGPAGTGVLVLDMGAPVPPGTPSDTVIFRREA